MIPKSVLTLVGAILFATASATSTDGDPEALYGYLTVTAVRTMTCDDDNPLNVAIGSSHAVREGQDHHR